MSQHPCTTSGDGYGVGMTTLEEAKALEAERNAFLARGRIAWVGRNQMRVWSLPRHLPNEGDWFVPVEVPTVNGRSWIKREVPPVEILLAVLELKELTNSVLKAVNQDAAVVHKLCAILALAMGEEAK